MFWEFLKEFGFNTYELKALQGLVKLGVATPSEISEAENIPSSKIYSALDRLESTGLIVKAADDKSYSLANQYQIVSILSELEKQKSQDFADSLGNLSKYLSHQSQVLEQPLHVIVEGKAELKQKLIFPSLVAPHDISIYWNVFNQEDLILLLDFIKTWEASERNYADRVLIYSNSEINIEVPRTRKISIRHLTTYKGNSLVLWGQKQVGMILSSTTQNHNTGIDCSDSSLNEKYLNEFEGWWLEGRPINPSYIS